LSIVVDWWFVLRGVIRPGRRVEANSSLNPFESWPTHHPFAPTCARSECTPTRQKVSFRELSPLSTGLRSAFFRLRPEGSEQDDHPDEPEADSQCDERHEWLGMAATRVRAFLDETESQEHEQQADPDDGQTRRDCETP